MSFEGDVQISKWSNSYESGIIILLGQIWVYTKKEEALGNEEGEQILKEERS